MKIITVKVTPPPQRAYDRARFFVRNKTKTYTYRGAVPNEVVAAVKNSLERKAFFLVKDTAHGPEFLYELIDQGW